MADFRWNFLGSKTLLVVQTALLVILLAAVVTLLYLFLTKNTQTEIDPEYAAANSKLFEYMNLEANPCEDFFEYTCGKFRDESMFGIGQFDNFAKVHSKQKTMSILPRLFNKIVEQSEQSCESELKISHLYHSCMDEFATLDQNGSLNITFMNTTETKLVEIVHDMFMKEFKFNVYKSTSDDKYNGPLDVILWPQHDAYLDPFLSPLFWVRAAAVNETLLAETSNIQIRHLSIDELQNFLPITLDEISGDASINEDLFQFSLDLIYKFQEKNFVIDQEGKAALDQSLHTSINELLNILPKELVIDANTASQSEKSFLFDNFRNLFPKWTTDKYNTTNDDITLELAANFSTYFEPLKDSSVLMNPNNFMQLQFFSTVFVLINKTTYKHPLTTREREIYCLNSLSDYFDFSFVASNAYMKYYTGEKLFHVFEDLIAKIKSQILERFEKVSNDTTRSAFKEYIKRIDFRPKIDQLDCDFTDVLLEDFESDPEKLQPYAQTFLSLRKLYQSKYLKIGNPRIYNMALEFNAFYDPYLHRILLLSFFLDTLFSDQKHVPMNYGDIGVVIAHEFSHSLDPNIISYFYMQELLDSKTRLDMNDFTNCILELFQAEGISNKSIGDNYSDIMGVTLSYEAMVKNENLEKLDEELRNSPILNRFSARELFFVSYGQLWCFASVNERKAFNLGNKSHAPNWARINVALSSIPEFAETFNCKDGDYMASNQQCKRWP